jgi:hypothetical protein
VAGAKTLQSISTRLISESTPESLYAQILGAAMELMVSDFASIQMLAADHASLKLLAWKNFHPDSAAFWEWVEVGAGTACSKALSDNERVVVADIEACEFMAGTQDQQEYRRLESAPCNRRRCDRDRAGLSACSRRTGGRRILRPKRISHSSTCSPGRPRI